MKFILTMIVIFCFFQVIFELSGLGDYKKSRYIEEDRLNELLEIEKRYENCI